MLTSVNTVDTVLKKTLLKKFAFYWWTLKKKKKWGYNGVIRNRNICIPSKTLFEACNCFKLENRNICLRFILINEKNKIFFFLLMIWVLGLSPPYHVKFQWYIARSCQLFNVLSPSVSLSGRFVDPAGFTRIRPSPTWEKITRIRIRPERKNRIQIPIRTKFYLIRFNFDLFLST